MSATDSRGRTIWIADAHRGDGKRFVVRAVEKLIAFMELESAMRAYRDWLTPPAILAKPRRYADLDKVKWRKTLRYLARRRDKTVPTCCR